MRTIGHTRTGMCICSGDKFGQLKFDPECPVKGFRGIVWSVAISPDGTRIVSGSDDNVVKIWVAATGAEVSSFL